MSTWFCNLFTRCHSAPQNGSFDPLPQQEPPTVQTQQPKAVLKHTKKVGDTKPTLLCCSSKKADDDQVDLCPKGWFQVHRGADVPWKMCFIMLCLPMCYPCYLTRTVRRRRRQHMDIGDKNHNSEDHELNKSFARDDPMTQTLLRQFTGHQHSIGLTAGPINVIDLNVIILRSGSSDTLRKLLLSSSDESRRSQWSLGGFLENEEPADRPMASSRVQFKLTAVPENDAADGGSVSEVDSPKLRAPRRNSAMSSFGRRVRGSFRATRWRSSFRSSRQPAAIEEEEESVQLRSKRGRRNERPLQQQRLLQQKESLPTSDSTGTVYYSFDSDDEEEEPVRVAVRVKDPSVEMKSLGTRMEMIRDLGYQLSFSVFDEAAVAEWKGSDLSCLPGNELPKIDLLVLAVKHDLNDLSAIQGADRGMYAYLTKFWHGFYPLLLIELESNCESLEESPSEFQDKIKGLKRTFGDVLHIKVLDESLETSMGWITECLARLFIHSRLYQCSRFYGQESAFENCPGGCGMKTTQSKKKLSRKRVKWKFKSLYRKSNSSKESRQD